MNKQEMVRRLVADSVNTALRETQCGLLQTMFEKGFMGYSNMPTERLKKEMSLRGLDIYPEEHEDDDYEDATLVVLSSFQSARPEIHYSD